MSVLGLMPPVHLEGRDQVDGALGKDDGFALSPAQHDGFGKLVTDLTQNRVYRKVPPRFLAVYRGSIRRYPARVDALLTRRKRSTSPVNAPSH